ncbi:MAG: hypothetical protein AN487_20435 [Anabaena sp. CRKS33]|nr:MAG: hypothetical protein AN487_20435 [Anabaena sp. CRKS33]
MTHVQQQPSAPRSQDPRVAIPGLTPSLPHCTPCRAPCAPTGGPASTPAGHPGAILTGETDEHYHT